MQLADFNYAMLRLIYSFYLVLFSSIVLIVGLLLVPLGYCSIVIVRIKIVLRECKIGRKRLNLLNEKSIVEPKLRAKVLSLIVFIITGVL